jgi:hypothetical protein
MAGEDSQERRTILEQVRRLSLSPSEAERWAEQRKLEPFAKRPNIAANDPMTELHWTLPMAAAWFLWRSREAVRDHSDEYRRSWTVWRRIPGPRKSDDFTCEVQAIGDANLRGIFASPDMLRFPHKRSWDAESPRRRIPTPVGSLDCSPRRRLSGALAAGSLMATGVAAAQSGDRIPLPAEFIRAYYHYLARGGALSDDDKLNPKFVASRKNPRPRYDRILFDRIAIIAAEEASSHRDFDDEQWLIEHVLGWIAYRNHNRFRLLARSAPAIRNFARATYPLDFVHHDPAVELLTALISGPLVARPTTETLELGIPDPVPQSWWRDRKLAEAPDLWFQKADVLRLWPPSNEINSTRLRGESYEAISTNPSVKMSRLEEKVVDVFEKLWPDGEGPPKVGVRDRAIIDEFKRMAWGPVSVKTIGRALRKRWS